MKKIDFSFISDEKRDFDYRLKERKEELKESIKEYNSFLKGNESFSLDLLEERLDIFISEFSKSNKGLMDESMSEESAEKYSIHFQKVYPMISNEEEFLKFLSRIKINIKHPNELLGLRWRIRKGLKENSDKVKELGKSVYNYYQFENNCFILFISVMKVLIIEASKKENKKVKNKYKVLFESDYLSDDKINKRFLKYGINYRI